MNTEKPAGPEKEAPERDPAELARKRAAAAEIAQRLSAIKRARGHSGGTAIWEQPGDAAAPAPEPPRRPAGVPPQSEKPHPPSTPELAEAPPRPARPTHADNAGASQHPFVTAYEKARAARGGQGAERAGHDVIHERSSPDDHAPARPRQAKATPPDNRAPDQPRRKAAPVAAAPGVREYRAHPGTATSTLPAGAEDRGLHERRPRVRAAAATRAPRRSRGHRAALLASLVAVTGTAAGAAAILLSPVGLQTDPAAMVGAVIAGNAMGRLAQISSPDLQLAATETAPVAAAPQTVTESATQTAPDTAAPPAAPPPEETAPDIAAAPAAPPTPEPAPQSAPEIAAAPAAEESAPTSTETPEASPKVAAAPAESPAASEPAPEPAMTPRPLAKFLSAPLPQISGQEDIPDAPISLPPTPGATSTLAAPAAPPAAPPEAFSGTMAPRIVATLKPTASGAAVPQPVAKPVAASQPVAKPVAKPASQPANKPKAFKPAPGPLDQVLDMIAPLMKDTGGPKPPTPSGNRK